jgi:hypothetical protein
LFSLIPWWLYVVLGLVLIGIPVLVLVLRHTGTGRNLTRAGLTDLGNMALADFLRYLTGVFGSLGYQVERVNTRQGDYGVDLVVVDGSGRRTAVNARHFKEPVDTPAIRQLAEGAAYHRCKDTLVVTTAKYSNGAIAAAEETGTMLWDLGDLADAAERMQDKPSFSATRGEVAASAASAFGGPQSAPQSQSEEDGPTGPPCPQCNSPTNARLAVGKEIWLCSRFPRCNGGMIREK